MGQKQDICPYCGGTETVSGKQNGSGAISPKDAWTVLNAQPLYHVVCKNCGTVIRSYVEYPKSLS